MQIKPDTIWNKVKDIIQGIWMVIIVCLFLVISLPFVLYYYIKTKDDKLEEPEIN